MELILLKFIKCFEIFDSKAKLFFLWCFFPQNCYYIYSHGTSFPTPLVKLSPNEKSGFHNVKGFLFFLFPLGLSVQMMMSMGFFEGVRGAGIGSSALLFPD